MLAKITRANAASAICDACAGGVFAFVERSFPGGLDIPMNDAGAKTCFGVVQNNAEEQVTWVTSYVAPDRTKTFCIYDGPSADSIHRAADANGLPVLTQVTGFRGTTRSTPTGVGPRLHMSYTAFTQFHPTDPALARDVPDRPRKRRARHPAQPDRGGEQPERARAAAEPLGVDRREQRHRQPEHGRVQVGEERASQDLAAPDEADSLGDRAGARPRRANAHRGKPGHPDA